LQRSCPNIPTAARSVNDKKPCGEHGKGKDGALRPGELVGELAMFDETSRLATVVAIERTVAVALFQAECSSLLMKNMSIGCQILALGVIKSG